VRTLAVQQDQCLQRLQYGAGISGVVRLNSAGAYNTGTNNTGIGALALFNNTTGSNNNAQGTRRSTTITIGSNNAALGGFALSSNTGGYGNNAMGVEALENDTTGFRNTAIGNVAGANVKTGSYNTYIGWSTIGPGDESNVTRIGRIRQAYGQFSADDLHLGYLGTPVSGSTAQVVVNANGQLGVTSSSERYKTDVAELGGTSEKLAQLRPVSFHLKTDPNGAVQYGLIAEEVDKVYPELVIRDNERQDPGRTLR
jgi:trimeric autotransporter adhesin